MDVCLSVRVVDEVIDPLSLPVPFSKSPFLCSWCMLAASRKFERALVSREIKLRKGSVGQIERFTQN